MVRSEVKEFCNFLETTNFKRGTIIGRNGTSFVVLGFTTYAMAVSILNLQLRPKGVYFVQSSLFDYKEKGYLSNLKDSLKVDDENAKDALKRTNKLMSLLRVGEILKTRSDIAKDISYVVLDVTDDRVCMMELYDKDLEDLDIFVLDESLMLECDYGEYLRYDFHSIGRIKESKANSIYIRSKLCQR